MHDYSRYSSPGGGVAGYGRGFESTVSYGVPPGYGYSAAADHSVARMYGSGAAYAGGGGSLYSAVPGYPARQPPGDDRDPYGVMDFYEKYRAHPYGAGGYYEVPVAAPSPPPPSSAISRERVARSGLDPYECPPPPATAAPISSYYARDRSPIRKAPAEAEGYGFEHSRASSMASLPRSTPYDLSRDTYTERARYAY